MVSDPTEVVIDAATMAQSAGAASDLVTMSTGVVLRTKKVPVGFITEIQRRYFRMRPKVPVVFIKNLGRTEENTDDPDYQERVIIWSQERQAALMDAMLLLGTELYQLPDGLDGPEGTSWRAVLEVLGEPIDERPLGLYLTWLKLIAAPTVSDLELLGRAVSSSTGISEEEVAAEAERF